jgi:hypothetical protein
MHDKTVVALYDHFDNAKAAVADLIQTGAPHGAISLLANSLTGDHPALSVNPAYAREEQDARSEEQSPLITGAEVGIGVGGVLGFLAAISPIVIPGIGILIAAGTLATVAAGAAAGGVLGGVIGALTGHGVSGQDSHLYAEGLKRGGTLVTVVLPEDQIEKATQVFKNHGAVDIEKRGAAWTAEGWVAFDPASHPMTQAEIEAERARSAAEGHEAEDHHAVRHYFHPGGAVLSGGATTETTHYAEDESGI